MINIETIGWTLIHSFWQISLVGIMVKIGLLVFKNKTSDFRHNLLLLGIVAIVTSVMVTFFHYTNHESIHLSEQQTITFQTSNEFNTVASYEPLNNIPYYTQFLGFIKSNINYLVYFWLIGVLFFSVRITGSYWYIQRLKKKFTQPVPEKWNLKFKTIGISLNIKRTIRFLESELIKIPMTIGYLKPVIIIPVGLLSSLPFNQIEAIITHELAHVKRNDYFINLVISILESIFFYHPVFWWLSKTINIERENCCDDLTIQYCGTKDHLQQALIDIFKINQKPIHIAAALYKNEFQLLKRIKRMKTKNLPKESLHHTNHEKKGNLIGPLVLLIGIIIFALGSAFSPRLSDLPDQTPGIHKSIEPIGIVPVLAVPAEIPVTEKFPATVNISVPNKVSIVNSVLESTESIIIPSIKAPDTTKKINEKKNEAEIKKIEKEILKAEKELEEAQKVLEEASTTYYNKLFELQKENGDETWSLFEKEYSEALALAEFKLQESNLELLHFNDLFFDSIADQFDNSFDLFEESFRLQELQQDLFEDQLWESMEEIHELEALQELELEDFQELEMKSLKLETSFKEELLEDGIIKDLDDKISIRLSNKTFEVNGEKQSNKIHEKYLKLYEDIFNDKLEGNTQMIIDDSH